MDYKSAIDNLSKEIQDLEAEKKRIVSKYSAKIRKKRKELDTLKSEEDREQASQLVSHPEITPYWVGKKYLDSKLDGLWNASDLLFLTTLEPEIVDGEITNTPSSAAFE